MIIQGEKAKSVLNRVSPDQEIGEDTARVGVTLLFPAGNIVLECSASDAPDGFVQVSVHRDSSVFAEEIKESFISRGGGQHSVAFCGAKSVDYHHH